MTEAYAIEKIGGGAMVVDYTGGRGRFGAAYAGKDGVWHEQPISVKTPFASDVEALKWAGTQISQPLAARVTT